MNAKKFSDAMDEIDNKYIEEAISYTLKSNSAKQFRRLRLALIAAILAMFLMGAGIVMNIHGSSIQNWFSHYWEIVTGQQMSDEQAAVIDHLSQDVGLKQSAGDITVTVDSATVGYDNFFLLLNVDGIQFSNKYAYGFEQIIVEIEPEPVDASNVIGGYGLQFHGIDGDGSILLLLDYSYTSGIDSTRDTRPINITLTLENLLQSPNMDKEKLVASGKWHFEFSLDRSREFEVIQLPNTEVMVMDLEKQELVPAIIENVELTSTGLSFQFDYNEGTLAIIESHISAVLNNGKSVSTGGGIGTPLEDGKNLNCSYKWFVPINLNEATCIQIGETQIVIPHN